MVTSPNAEQTRGRRRPSSFVGRRTKPQTQSIAGDLLTVDSHAALPKLPDQTGGWWKKTKFEWIPMIDPAKDDVKNQIKDAQSVRDLDEKRKKMLTIARSVRPIHAVGKLSLLPRTVLPRIFKWKITWAIIGFYVIAASFTRSGWDFGDVDTEKFDAGTSVVTFMLVFYVGYCYTRYNQMFSDVEHLMHSLTDACMLARVHFMDLNEVHRFWRYCNMLHAAAYTSLTVAYSEENFFRPVCERFQLYARDEVDRANEHALLSKVSLDGDDTRACAMLEIWLLEIIRDELYKKIDKPSPIFKNLNDEVQKMGDCVKRLFGYQYQVLPFVYTHLVAGCCVSYLAASAFVKGLQFEPDQSYTFGCILPFCSVLILICAVFGLLEVGDTILDPFGVDAEDFAVLHFVECTVVSSLEVIQVDSVMPRHKVEFYSNQELRSAVAVVTRLVYRFRMRKRRREVEQEERLKAEEAARVAEAAAKTVEVRASYDTFEEFEVDAAPASRDLGSGCGSSHLNWGELQVAADQDGDINSSRGDFRLEGRMSEKPLKARPLPEGASFKQKARKPTHKKPRNRASLSPVATAARVDGFSC